MSRILTIANQKGGAGKSPTAVHLSYALSKAGNSVLIVDADSQATTSLHFLGLKYKQQQPTLYNALITQTRIDPLVVSPTLHLLPAHDELERADVELTSKPGSVYQKKLAMLLQK